MIYKIVDDKPKVLKIEINDIDLSKLDIISQSIILNAFNEVVEKKDCPDYITDSDSDIELDIKINNWYKEDDTDNLYLYKCGCNCNLSLMIMNNELDTDIILNNKIKMHLKSRKHKKYIKKEHKPILHFDI